MAAQTSKPQYADIRHGSEIADGTVKPLETR